MENFNEYMYKSLVDIKELDLMIESYKPLTAAERFFMEADEEEKHEKVKKGIISKIKEVIKTIIAMIGKVLTFIKEKLMVIFADKDTKIKMEIIREKIKQNPELANARRRSQWGRLLAFRAVTNGLKILIKSWMNLMI